MMMKRRGKTLYKVVDLGLPSYGNRHDYRFVRATQSDFDSGIPLYYHTKQGFKPFIDPSQPLRGDNTMVDWRRRQLGI